MSANGSIPNEVAELQAAHEHAIAEDWHPLLIDARLQLLEEARARQADIDEGLYRLRKAILLAPTLELCEALLRSEQVPLERLNPERLARLRRKP